MPIYLYIQSYLPHLQSYLLHLQPYHLQSYLPHLHSYLPHLQFLPTPPTFLPIPPTALPTLPTVLPTPTYSLTHQHISQFYPPPPMVLITLTCATTLTVCLGFCRFTPTYGPAQVRPPHLWSCPTPPMAQPLPTVLPPIYGTTSSLTRTANATYHSRIVSVELQETVEVFLE